MNTVKSWRAVSLAITIAAATSWAASPAAAQQPVSDGLRVLADTTAVQQVELMDGTKLLGRIVGVEGTAIAFRTLGGFDIDFQRRDVKGIRIVRGQRYRGEFWPADPSDSRLFLAPTGRVPGHGHGYFGVYELVIPSFGVGLGKIGMISGGFSVLPGVSLDEQVFYIAPKAQVFNTEYVQGAVGLFWAKTGTSDESFGMVYSGVTAGTARAAFSGGLAFPFSSEDGFLEQQLLMLGGELRAARNLKLITENWFAPGEEESIWSLGLRIISSRITVEVAAATTSEGGFLPIVNFSTTW
jgi:hypothetical protein